MNFYFGIKLFNDFKVHNHHYDYVPLSSLCNFRINLEIKNKRYQTQEDAIFGPQRYVRSFTHAHLLSRLSNFDTFFDSIIAFPLLKPQALSFFVLSLSVPLFQNRRKISSVADNIEIIVTLAFIQYHNFRSSCISFFNYYVGNDKSDVTAAITFDKRRSASQRNRRIFLVKIFEDIKRTEKY